MQPSKFFMHYFNKRKLKVWKWKEAMNESSIHQPHQSFRNHLSMHQVACLPYDPDQYSHCQYLLPGLRSKQLAPLVRRSPMEYLPDQFLLPRHFFQLFFQLRHCSVPQQLPLMFAMAHPLIACASFSYCLHCLFSFVDYSCRLKVDSLKWLMLG